jgi:hypothetical protein
MALKDLLIRVILILMLRIPASQNLIRIPSKYIRTYLPNLMSIETSHLPLIISQNLLINIIHSVRKIIAAKFTMTSHKTSAPLILSFKKSEKNKRRIKMEIGKILLYLKANTIKCTCVR